MTAVDKRYINAKTGKPLTFAERVILDAESESDFDLKKDTGQIEKKKTIENVIMSPETKTLNSPTKENGIVKISSKSELKSLSDETEETHQESLEEQLRIIQQGVFSSMNLIDSSAKHLHDLMLSTCQIHAGQQELPISQLDRVKAATSCAQQIHNLLKVKADTINALGKFNG